MPYRLVYVTNRGNRETVPEAPEPFETRKQAETKRAWVYRYGFYTGMPIDIIEVERVK